MNSLPGRIGVDLNNPSILILYNQIFLFQRDHSQEEILFTNASYSEQKALQSISHGLSLEYEYSLATRTVRICRRTPSGDSASCDSGYSDFQNCKPPGDIESWSEAQLDIPMLDIDTENFSSRSANEATINEDPFFPGLGNCNYEVRSFVDKSGQKTSAEIELSDESLSSLGCDSCCVLEIYCDGRRPSCGSCTWSETSCYYKPLLWTPLHDMDPDIPLDPLSTPEHYSMDLATRAKWIPTAFALDDAVGFICPPYKPCDEEKHNQLNLDTNLQQSGLLFPWPATAEFSHPSSSSFLVEVNAELSKSKSKQRDIPETLDPEARKRLKSRIAQRKTRDKVKAGKEHLKWAFENAPGTSNAYHTINSENSKKTDVVNGPEYAATLDQSSTSSQRATSFSSSVGSIQRDGSQSELDNSFRRWRRANCSANLGYETVVFDASSTYSTRSQVSATSASSGRLGPLSSLARAGMNAVIKVGACWRCRFLRKPCDPISPCGLCPKGNKSGWEAVGCKRGSFKAAMLPITLCPKATTVVTGSPAQLPGSSTSHETSSQPDVAANTFFRDTMNRREMALARLVQATEYSAEVDPMLHDMEIRPLLQECLPGNCTPIKQPGLAALNPLNECILAIAWELFDYPFSCFDITETGDLGGLVRLLPSVARYQAKHQSELNSDQLIAQSLICLRSCLEALRIKASGFLGKQRHVSCNSGLCKFECLEYVKLNISLYFDELSRVFFKKENMRNKTTWWLSAFYSFCIQSFVRRALLELEKESLVFATLASRDYLRDPVQLFIAISSSDDPLIRPLARDLSGKVKTNAMVEGPNLGDYEEARLAVGQNTWLTDGISGSYDYLTSLFGDQKVEEQSTTNGSPRDSLEF